MSRSISKSFLDFSCLGPSSPRWVAPCPGSFKINCDGAIMSNICFGSTAFVVRDSKRCFCEGGSASFPCRTSCMAEATAIKLALDYAVSIQPCPVQIELDCKILVEASRDPSKLVQWECFDVMVDIAGSLASSEFINISWVPRSANKAAHWIAYAEKCALLPKDWPSSPPKDLTDMLLLDFDRVGVG